MKTFKILTTLLLLAFATPASAGQIINVGVNGMVCDFCAQALTKVFMSKEQVQDIDVSLNDKIVRVTLKDGQDMDDETVTELINNSGYDVREITRMEENAAEIEEGTDGPAS